MFIHLGGDTVIRSKDVIAILDSEVSDSSTITKEFIEHFNEDETITISDDLTKSIVLTGDKVYFSPISSSTLKRRAQFVSDFENFTDVEL